MPRKRCTMRLRICAARCARSFGDRQRFDLKLERAVFKRFRLSCHSHIDDDVATNVELRFAQASRQSAADFERPRWWDAELDFMPLADEGQRLPVYRSDFGKQNPITGDCGAIENRAQQPGGCAGHGYPHHWTASM